MANESHRNLHESVGLGARAVIAALAVAMLGWGLALLWPHEEAAAPLPLRHATPETAFEPDDGSAATLEMEERARKRYCEQGHGRSFGSHHRLCDFGFCTGAAGEELCGIREVVCDDVQDAHQCGVMARKPVADAGPAYERGPEPRSGEHGPADYFDRRTAEEP